MSSSLDAVLAELIPAESLCGRLRAGAEGEWSSYVDHPFVRGMGDGTLSEESFRHYLIQDYLFLVQFCRAYALAVYKGGDLEEMRQGTATLDALLNIEMGLHVKYCAGWDVTEAQMLATPEARATIAYTRYVLDQGMAGDLLDLLVALAPCVVGYGEIGLRLAHDPATKRESNRYMHWIEMYSGSEYLDVVRATVAQLDRVAEKRAGVSLPPTRAESLQANFTMATRLEADFWQMGFALEQ